MRLNPTQDCLSNRNANIAIVELNYLKVIPILLERNIMYFSNLEVIANFHHPMIDMNTLSLLTLLDKQFANIYNEYLTFLHIMTFPDLSLDK